MSHMLKLKSPLVFACVLYLAIVSFYTVAAIWYPMAYIWATYEDLAGEWVQFWSIAVAFAIATRLAFTRSRFRWFFSLLAVSCFYVAMEEISWGQRLIGFSSPDYFRANNLQGETNIHNFLTGPFGTNLKAALSYGLAIALALYGLVYPLMLRFRFRLAMWFDARGLASPPLYLWPYFATAAFLECSPFRINEAEVAEILVGLGLTLMTVHYQFTRSGSQDVPSTDADAADTSIGLRGAMSARLAFRLGMATTLVLVFSAGTTTALYASPSRKARIDRRIQNGVEKFAGRYARYERWGVAIDLYERVLEEEPDRVSILRRLSECARNMGDQAKFDEYIHRALAIDLKNNEEHPRRASVNRSLTRTYRALGDNERAQQHIKWALNIALHRVEKHPDSASAAYSLGKTYSLMANRGRALEEMSRAFTLRPHSKKYRKAYYRAKGNTF